MDTQILGRIEGLFSEEFALVQHDPHENILTTSAEKRQICTDCHRTHPLSKRRITYID